MSQTSRPTGHATGQTVREAIRTHYAALTQSERKFAQALLDNYPAAGLASITIAAANAQVSTPTLARLVQKLGFKGYPQFQQALLAELEAKASGPTQRRDQCNCHHQGLLYSHELFLHNANFSTLFIKQPR